MLTEKENFLRALNGECPEWIPQGAIIITSAPPGDPPPVIQHMPRFLSVHRDAGVGGKDIWGVNYVPVKQVWGATLPEPNHFILHDITKWRDVIQWPDVSGFDWEKIVKDNMKETKIDRGQTALGLYLHFGYFQHLVSFMGFTEGLCAFIEEPEEVKALLHYLCDFYCMITDKVIDYYQPDMIYLADDTAALRAPFISPQMYEEILCPLYDRHAAYARARNIPVGFHNCGHCEDLMEPLMRCVGVNVWDPAQTVNDLPKIKATYGNRLVIAGGWEPKERLLTDDAIYQSLKETFDSLAPGGGYFFCGMLPGVTQDEAGRQRQVFFRKTVNELCRNYYKH